MEYGETVLPEFSDPERAVRSLDISLVRLRQDYPDFPQAFEKIKGLEGSVALRAIDQVVVIFVDGMLSSGGIEPSLARHALSAVSRKEWSGVTPGTGESFALHELVAKTNRLKHELVALWIQDSPRTGLTKTAEAEYLSLGPAMAALDVLYLRLITDPSPIDSDERTRRGMTDECSVVRERNGEIVEVKLHDAYPAEIAAITGAYRNLLQRLRALAAQEGGGGEADLLARKIRYYEAVLKAFETSDKERWLEADTLLPQQVRDGGDVMHIHPIERGYMRDRHIREPEISLRAPDSEASRTQELSAETKARMLRMMDDPMFADIPTMEGSKALVGISNATARHVLGSGTEMDLKIAGQILPNELETRVNGGIDTSLDVTTVVERQPVTSAAFISVFGEKAFSEQYEPLIDPEHLLGDSVASHEFGHAIGLAPDTEQRLGQDLVAPYIEEWKATAGGLVFNTWLPFLKGETSIDTLRVAIMHQLAGAARYSKNRDQESALGYYRQSIMLMKVAEETGIVVPGDEETPWKICIDDDAAVIRFFEVLTGQYHRLLQIYATGTREELMEFLGQHLQPTAFVQYMARAVEEPGKPLKDPAQLVRLPA